MIQDNEQSGFLGLSNAAVDLWKPVCGDLMLINILNAIFDWARGYSGLVHL